MEMMTYNLVGRCAQEHLNLFGSKGLLCPCLRDPSIIPDTRQSRISFILQLIPGTLPLIPKRNNFFNQEVGEAVLVVLVLGVVGVAGMTEASLSITRTFLAPRLERSSFFLALIWANIP